MATNDRQVSPLSQLSSLDTVRALVDRLREGIYITNPEGVILDANPAFLEMFGLRSVKQLRKYRAADLLVRPENRERELEAIARDGSVREFELQIRRPDGKVRTVLDSCYAVVDPHSEQMLYHGILIDITPIKDLEEQLREQATRDPLTGCYNRRFLNDYTLNLQVEGTEWGAAVIDIDHFKTYNDKFGHQVGDQVLLKTARFLMRQVRAEDVVCRIGGDEFLILLPNTTKTTTERIITRIQRAARKSAPVPFSLGWSARENGESLESTIGRADRELISVRVEVRNFHRPQKTADGR